MNYYTDESHPQDRGPSSANPYLVASVNHMQASKVAFQAAFNHEHGTPEHQAQNNQGHRGLALAKVNATLAVAYAAGQLLAGLDAAEVVTPEVTRKIIEAINEAGARAARGVTL